MFGALDNCEQIIIKITKIFKWKNILEIVHVYNLEKSEKPQKCLHVWIKGFLFMLAIMLRVTWSWIFSATSWLFEHCEEEKEEEEEEERHWETLNVNDSTELGALRKEVEWHHDPYDHYK